jgi:16S rRNA U516 pseudouridylate synthase RsuA-like enzyme
MWVMKLKKAMVRYRRYKRRSEDPLTLEQWIQENNVLILEKKKKCCKKKGKVPRNGHPMNHNRHHMLNKCNGGTWDTENILWLDIERHEWWHKIFRNLSHREVIELLIRTYKMKHHERVEGECPTFEEIPCRF